MANIIIKYFGIAQEITKKEEEKISFDGTLNHLLNYLYQHYPRLNNSKIQIVHNMKVLPKNPFNSKTDIHLSDGDEIALLPPFAGG